MPLSLIILVGLFVLQSRGTDHIGKLFGPVMVIWFVVIASLGAAVDPQSAGDPGRRQPALWRSRCSCTSRGSRSSRSAPSCWR